MRLCVFSGRAIWTTNISIKEFILSYEEQIREKQVQASGHWKEQSQQDSRQEIMTFTSLQKPADILMYHCLAQYQQQLDLGVHDHPCGSQNLTKRSLRTWPCATGLGIAAAACSRNRGKEEGGLSPCNPPAPLCQLQTAVEL